MIFLGSPLNIHARFFRTMPGPSDKSSLRISTWNSQRFYNRSQSRINELPFSLSVFLPHHILMTRLHYWVWHFLHEVTTGQTVSPQNDVSRHARSIFPRVQPLQLFPIFCHHKSASVSTRVFFCCGHFNFFRLIAEKHRKLQFINRNLKKRWFTFVIGRVHVAAN